MRWKPVAAGLAGIAAVAALAAWAQGGAPDARGAGPGRADLSVLGMPVTEAMLRDGAQIYAENCAACHGARLEGQPDWRRRGDDGRMPAPPHDDTGHSWHHADRDLFAITKLGVGAVVPGYDSDMPAFGDLLTDDEIRAVLAFIKSRWSDRAREAQARINAARGDEP